MIGVERLGALGRVAAAQPAVAAPTKTASSAREALAFGDVMRSMIEDADRSLRQAEKVSIDGLTGKASVQDVVETVMQAEQKVQLTAAVRDKIVAAYLELTRMPI